jgi:hypothetical protein
MVKDHLLQHLYTNMGLSMPPLPLPPPPPPLPSPLLLLLCRYPFTSNMYVSHVDLDDVAAGICGLLATPGASGRCAFIISGIKFCVSTKMHFVCI